MTGSFIVELEKDGVRTFYGPFPNSDRAIEFSGYYRDAQRVLVQRLVKPLVQRLVKPLPPPSHIHLNQTTIADHIEDVEDYIDPTTVD